MRKKRGIFISLVAFLVFTAVIVRVFPLKYREAIVQNAAQNGLDPALVAAQIYTESRFDPKAISSQNATGLMQIRPETAMWFSEKNEIEYRKSDLVQGEKNIALGCKYLRYLLQETGDLKWALAAYNAGLARVRQWQAEGIQCTEDIPYPETKNYVKKVLQIKKIYSALYVFKEI